MQIYVVKPGDTIYRISRQFGVTIDSLLAINTLPDPNILVVGQSLVISQDEPGYTSYIVKPGDTLYAIAARFGTTVETLVLLNNLTDPNLIFSGQVLTVPLGVTYVVKRGDTLYRIAQRFDTTVAALQEANNIINPNILYPGQILVIPKQGLVERTMKETLGFLVITSPKDMVERINEIGDNFTYLALFSYPVNMRGEITGIIAPQVVETIRAKNAAPLAVISNFDGTTFDSDLARAILANTEIRENFVGNILSFVETNNLAGVNIDFENMYPEDRDLYTDFMRVLYETLNPAGYIVSNAMAPKWADWPERAWVGAFDYSALAPYLDFGAIMTYEWGWVGGPPMPIAPLNLVRRVIEYAKTQMPEDKIIMGMPLYGYDWELPDTPENLAATVTLREALIRAARYGAGIQWDSDAQSPFFLYTNDEGVAHEVWFEDARSQHAKYLLARELGVRGVSYWQVGYRFPETWYILNKIFAVRKIV